MLFNFSFSLQIYALNKYMTEFEEENFRTLMAGKVWSVIYLALRVSPIHLSFSFLWIHNSEFLCNLIIFLYFITTVGNKITKTLYIDWYKMRPFSSHGWRWRNCTWRFSWASNRWAFLFKQIKNILYEKVSAYRIEKLVVKNPRKKVGLKWKIKQAYI